MRRDELNELLNRSDPVGELSETEQRLTAELVYQSGPTRRRRYARPVAAGALAVVLVGGGAMAAAAATGLWSPWAQDDALFVVKYELPSGADCEFRLGNVQGKPDEVAKINEVIRETLAGAEFDDREIAEVAASVGVPGHPATDDRAYETGFTWAIQLRIEEALIANDLNEKWASIGGEGYCS